MLTTLDRCYRLMHERRGSNGVRTNSSTTSLHVYGAVAGRYLRRHVFDAVKRRLTRMDHNLYDVVWPSVKKLPNERSVRAGLDEDFVGGIVAPDYYVFDVFREYLVPLVKDLHCVNVYSELKPHPESVFFDDYDDDDYSDDDEENANGRMRNAGSVSRIDLDLDPYSKFISSGTIELCRNFDQCELPLSLNLGTLEEVERVLTTELFSDEVTHILNGAGSDEHERGTYYTLNEILESPSEIRAVLATAGLLIPLWALPGVDNHRLHGRHWPYGRGVFVSHSGDTAAWVNVLDHVRVITCTATDAPGNIGAAYTRIAHLMAHLDAVLNFKRDSYLGYLSSRPTFIGNAMRCKLSIRFPHLSKEIDNLRQLCAVRGLSFRQDHFNTDLAIVANYQCLSVTELQTFRDFTTAIANILQLERDLGLSNSMHIAAMFVNIFKRKKASLTGSIDN